MGRRGREIYETLHWEEVVIFGQYPELWSRLSQEGQGPTG